MVDLAPEDVRRMAAAIGLVVADDDLEDVTFRLGAILEHVAALERLEPADAGGRPSSPTARGRD
ncbi:MAG TPA: hypothetical protein VMS64_21565 [Candidatus Methylomirabilis sp.]|nr:hypothetical protein [Candidatus Methylomirabilis sp.]